MVKRIVVLSRKEVEKALDNKVLNKDILGDWALISIYAQQELMRTFDRMDSFKNLKGKKFISLRFRDIETVVKGIEAYSLNFLFNEEHAKRIINFIEEVKETVETLVVQCAAGISRSGAVGLFACRYLKLDETEFRSLNKISPNMHVLRVLNEVSGVNKEYVEFWEQLAEKRPRAIKHI